MSDFPQFNRIKPCRHGLMMFNANDTIIRRSLDLYGEFSQGEAELFASLVRPGMVVIEVGANIGAHTVQLAKAVGRAGLVVAFEPQRIVFQTLCANLALNSLTNVNAFHLAVGAAPGSPLVPFLDYTKSNNFGGVDLGSDRTGEQVGVTTLGHGEKRSGRGANLIAALRPLIYVENDRQDRSAELIRALDRLGYSMFWHKSPLINSGNFNGSAANVFGEMVSVNMLCVPRGPPRSDIVGDLQPVAVP